MFKYLLPDHLVELGASGGGGTGYHQRNAKETWAGEGERINQYADYTGDFSPVFLTGEKIEFLGDQFPMQTDQNSLCCVPNIRGKRRRGTPAMRSL